MKIAVVIGSRADAPGILAIADALEEQGMWIIGHRLGPAANTRFDTDSVKQWREWPISDADAVVILGDRAECALAALQYRELGVSIAHIHAGEITAQEPDDTYRDIITRLSTWCFVPHETAELRLTLGKNFGATPHGAKVFNCGSPFITAAAKAERLNVSDLWPEGKGKKVFIAFNPLPENEEETAQIADLIHRLTATPEELKYRIAMISPNTDRNRHAITKATEPPAGNCQYYIKEYASLTHAQYIALVNDADAIIGNTSAGIIEATYRGTPYVCIGSRQTGRVMGPNCLCQQPGNGIVALDAALEMGCKSSNVYGEADSAQRIAVTLKGQINDLD